MWLEKVVDLFVFQHGLVFSIVSHHVSSLESIQWNTLQCNLKETGGEKKRKEKRPELIKSKWTKMTASVLECRVLENGIKLGIRCRNNRRLSRSEDKENGIYTPF